MCTVLVHPFVVRYIQSSLQAGEPNRTGSTTYGRNETTVVHSLPATKFEEPLPNSTMKMGKPRNMFIITKILFSLNTSIIKAEVPMAKISFQRPYAVLHTSSKFCIKEILAWISSFLNLSNILIFNETYVL